MATNMVVASEGSLRQVKWSPVDYKSEEKPIWCAGCGDFGLLSAFYKAFAERQFKSENVVFVSGIGCSSRLPDFIKAYGFHSVHGRLLPIALGIKMAKPEFEVIAVGGDGDGLAIGGNHFMHAARRNPDIAYVMMDNSVYGMTKGQPSPTSLHGMMTKASPHGVLERPVNPVALAIAYGATWVGQGFSGKPKELQELILEAVDHRGFAFLRVLSPCVTFHDTYDLWRSNLAEMEPHDLTDKVEAFRLALRSDKIRTGIFYETKGEMTFEENYRHLEQRIRKGKTFQMEDFFEEYK